MADDTQAQDVAVAASCRRAPVHDATPEDLGDDVRALAVVARQAGRASVVRRVDGVLVRVIVEAA